MKIKPNPKCFGIRVRKSKLSERNLRIRSLLYLLNKNQIKATYNPNCSKIRTEISDRKAKCRRRRSKLTWEMDSPLELAGDESKTRVRACNGFSFLNLLRSGFEGREASFGRIWFSPMVSLILLFFSLAGKESRFFQAFAALDMTNARVCPRDYSSGLNLSFFILIFIFFFINKNYN